MKNKILIAVFLFSQLISFGQDEKAEKILKDLSANTKSYSYMDVDFDFIFINTSQDINESQKGNIKINTENSASISKGKFSLNHFALNIIISCLPPLIFIHFEMFSIGNTLSLSP